MFEKKLNRICEIESGYGLKINRGANDQEIKILNLQSNMKLGFSLPSEYMDVLKIINGLDFNGFVLYGIDTEFLGEKPLQPIQGIVLSNLEWYELEDNKRYIFFGTDNISWYVWDKLKESYFLLDKPSGDEVEEYQSFDDMFRRMLETSLL